MWPTLGYGYGWPRARPEAFDLRWTRTVAPTLTALGLREAKDHIRITQPNMDASVLSYVAAATDAAELYMNRGLLTQTWQLNLHWFADVMYLPMAAPLQSVTTVQYYDTAGTLQTLATTYYDVDTVSRPGRILRAANQAWPALQSGKLGGRVIVTYVVGWTDATLIPERIKQGIRIYLAWLDTDREGMDPDAVRGRASAEACWADQVYAIDPTQTMYGYGLYGCLA